MRRAVMMHAVRACSGNAAHLRCVVAPLATTTELWCLQPMTMPLRKPQTDAPGAGLGIVAGGGWRTRKIVRGRPRARLALLTAVVWLSFGAPVGFLLGWVAPGSLPIFAMG